jgi:putative adhesin
MPSLNPLRFALFPLLSALLLPACDVNIKDGDVSFGEMRAQAVREWKRTYPISAGGRIEVVNVNGPVEIGPGAPGTVDIAAVLTAKALSEKRAHEILDDTKIEESAAPDHIRVATERGGPHGPGGLSVSYKVSIPSDARLEVTVNNGKIFGSGLAGHTKAMVVNGTVELNALRGSVDVASVNGSITARMAEVTDRVRLEGTNGAITLEIPKTTGATLSARSINGGIRVNGIDAAAEASGRRIRSLETALNGGGPEIDVRITNGGITIEGK